jgi:hypothetical protein
MVAVVPVQVNYQEAFPLGLTISCSLPRPRLMRSTSVVDTDPYVFGPPGYGSVSTSTRYGSGSGSFHHQAKIVRKTLISSVLL